MSMAQQRKQNLPASPRSGGGTDSEVRAVHPVPDTLDIAVRAYAEPSKKRPVHGNKRPSAPPSEWTLVFDTETNTDASQRFRVGTYQIYKKDDLHEQGLFYVPDDPLALTSADIATIKLYARRNRFELRTVADFVDNVFYEVGYHWRATIVGFNLPFDISRLALHHESARAVTFTPKDDPDIKVTSTSMVGGFTFQLSQSNRPRVRVKHRSSKDAFYQFTNLIKGGRGRRGFFIDVRTTASALLGKPFSLKKLAEGLNPTWKIARCKTWRPHHG